MNPAISWLYRHVGPGLEVPKGPFLCACCGLPHAEGKPPDHVFRPTFTDYDLLKVPHSGSVCPACAWYFDHQELRRQHWYISPSEAKMLAKADILPLLAQHVQNPPNEDRCYLIAQSKKKHVILRARINAAGCSRLRVNFETMLVDVDRDFFALVHDLALLHQFHTWQEIEHDDYLPYAILLWPSLSDFEKTRDRVRPWLGTPQYLLAKFLYSPDLLEGGNNGVLPR